MSETYNILNNLVVRLFNQILQLEESNLQKQGIELTMSEVHVIEAVCKASTNTMGDIAKYLSITLGSLTTAVGKLEDKGYLERYKLPDDLRRVYVKVTKKGDNINKIHNEFHHQMIEKAIIDLKLEEDLVLISSLKRIAKHFEENY